MPLPPKHFSLESGTSNPPTAEQAAEIRATLGAAAADDVTSLQSQVGAGGRSSLKASDTYVALGTEPVDPLMLAHLSFKDEYEVIVDHADKITEAGNFTHQDVIEAAKGFLRNGAFGAGVIRLSGGIYYLTSTLTLDARVSIEGATTQLYPGGTTLFAASGFSGTFLLASLNSGSPPQGNANGNFETHWRNLFIDCAGRCSGVSYGGAQCSSLENIWVDSATTYGVYVRDGCPAIRLEDIKSSGSYGIYFAGNGNGVSLVNLSFGGNTTFGISFAPGVYSVLGAHMEHLTYPFHLRSWKSEVTATGIYFKATNEYTAGKTALVKCDSHGQRPYFYLRGAVRDVDSTVGWYIDDTTFVEVRDLVGSAANAYYPVDICPREDYLSNTSVVSAYTPTIEDHGKYLICDGTFDITLEDALYAGDQFTAVNKGSGIITLVPDAGVTIEGPTTLAAGDGAIVRKRTTNTFQVFLYGNSSEAAWAEADVSSDLVISSGANRVRYYIDASGGDVDITLPAVGGTLQEFEFKRIDSSGNTVQILPDGTETFDSSDETSVTLLPDNAFTTRSRSSKWWIF